MPLNNASSRRLIAAAAAILLALSFPSANAAESNGSQTNRDARSVIVQMRLRRLTQDLNLDKEQQAKFKALLDQETIRIAEFQTNQDLTLPERFKKQQVVHEDIQIKMRDVLNDEQRPKWDVAVAKAKAKKKAAVEAAKDPKARKASDTSEPARQNAASDSK